MAQVGDMVRFLNDVGGGRIVKIKDNIAYVEDEDGFENPVLLRECVVVGSASKFETIREPSIPPATARPTPVVSQSATDDVDDLPIEETPDGDRLNIVLAYEPTDLKHLSTSKFDTYLVNDSNYYLYFSYMTKSDGADGWSTRYAGIVEPNIQIYIGEVIREDLPDMDRIAIQYIAFKKDKDFQLKSPSLIELPLDTTKFAKLHCFRDNEYFDIPVIAMDLVKNDAPYKRVVISQPALEAAIRTKANIDKPRRKQVVKKRSKHNRRGDTLVIDLHIGELVDTIRGLSNADMLNLQVDEFCRIMDENLKNKGQKIVFIHGKGEGVLRNAIMKELSHRYKGHDVQDASFREYGFGATQVTIR